MSTKRGTAEAYQKAIRLAKELDSELLKADPNIYSGWLYGNGRGEDGVFAFYEDDVISDLSTGGSLLTQWLPTKTVKTLDTHVSHLSWVSAEGYDGSGTYMQHLIDQDAVGECDFGEGADYQVYEFSHSGHRISFSNKNKPISMETGIPQHEKITRKVLRGARAGQSIATDAEWTISMLLELLEGHLAWNNWYGEPAAATTGNGNMYDGLLSILTPGWVQSKLIGGGTPTWADPVVLNGASLDTVQKQLRVKTAVASKIIQRMLDRGYRPTSNDMAFVMSATHWRVYSEALAAGTLTELFRNDIELTVTPESVQREMDRVRVGGLGFGAIEVMGIPIPVIPDNLLGHNVGTLSNGNPGVIGNSALLTRFYRGLTVLEAQYLDWSTVPNKAPNNGERDLGLLSGNNAIRSRYGFTDAMQLCWYYGLDLQGRIVSSMQPLQAVFQDMLVETVIDSEIESGNFAHPDFYAYDGVRGHQGTALITGLSA